MIARGAQRLRGKLRKFAREETPVEADGDGVAIHLRRNLEHPGGDADGVTHPPNVVEGELVPDDRTPPVGSEPDRLSHGRALYELFR